MAEERKIQLGVAVDATGAKAGFDQVKTDAQAMAQAVGQAGQAAGKGIASIGDGGTAASGKVDAATRNMIGSIQRATAALDAGSKSGAKYYEALAAQRGISTDALRPYLAQLDAANALHAKGATSVVTFSKGLDSAKLAAIGFGTALVGSLAAAVSFGVLKSLVTDSVAAAEKLHDLAIQTGATVEALSGLSQVGRLSDVGVDQIASSMNKLAKNLAGTTEESKGAGMALKALGIDFDKFKQLSPDEQFKALAKSLDGFKDGAGKGAAMMAMLGKEGAKLLPMFKDLAVAGDLVAKVTTEQAAMADNFSDNLTRLKISGETWKKELVFGMLPALDLGLQAFIDVSNASSGMRGEITKLSREGTLAEWAQSGITGISYLIDGFIGVKRVIQSVAEFIAASAASSVQFFTSIGEAASKATRLDFSGAVGTLAAGVQTQKDIWKSLGTTIDNSLGESTFGQKLRARMAELSTLGATARAVKPDFDFTNNLNKSEKSAKALADAFRADVIANYAKGLEDFAKIAGDASAKADDLSKTQAKLREIQASPTWAAYSRQQQEQLIYSASLSQAEEDRAEQVKKTAEAIKLAADEYKKYIDAQDGDLKKLREQVESEAEHVSAIGITKEAVAQLAAGKLDAAAATKIKAAAEIEERDGDLSLAKVYREQADELQKLATLKRTGGAKEASVEAAKKAEEEWNKTADSINQSLTDALLRGFESGKDFASNFRDTLVNMFKTLVLRPIIQGVVQTGMSAVGLGGTAIQGGNNTGGLFGTVTGGMSLADRAGGVGSAFMAGYGGMASTGVGGVGATFGVVDSAVTYGGVAATTSGGLAAGMSTALAAIPVWGWAVLAAAAIAAYVGSGGGPKSEGGYSPNGLNIAGVDIGGNMQGSVRGDVSSAEKISTGISDGFANLAKTFDLSIEKLGVGVFYAIDNADGGTSQTQLQITSKNYNRSNLMGGIENVDRGDPAFQKAIVESTADLYLTELQKALTGRIGDYFKTLDPLELSAEQINAAITLAANAQALWKAFDLLGPSFANLSAMTVEATSAFADAAGGLDVLKANLSSYYDNFYTEEEKRQNLAGQIAKTVGAVGISATADSVLSTTRQQFRDLMDQYIAMGEAGQPVVQALLAVNGAFASLVPAADNVATNVTAAVDAISETLKRLQADGASLQVELLRAQGKGTEADALQRTLDTTGFTALEIAAYDANAALRTLIQTTLDTASAAHTAAVATATANRDRAQGEADAFLATAGDLAGAMAELDPPAKTLVERFRATRDELTALTSGLAEALGNLPAPTTLEAFKANMAMLKSISQASADLNNSIFDIKVGRGDQSAVDLLKSREAALFGDLATSADPAAVAQQLSRTVLQRIQLEGKLEEQAVQGRYQAEYDAAKTVADLEAEKRRTQMDTLREQISGAQRLADIAASMQGFIAQLKYGDLSALNPVDQLAAAQSDYQRILEAAKGGDATAAGSLQGASSAYLQEQQKFSGGATSGYASTFAQVLSDLEAFGATPVSDITLMQDQLAELGKLSDASVQLQTVVVDTSQQQIDALASINAALSARSDSVKQQADEQLVVLKEQVVQLSTLVDNQETQIRLASTTHKELVDKVAGLQDSLDRIANNTNELVTAP